MGCEEHMICAAMPPPPALHARLMMQKGALSLCAQMGERLSGIKLEALRRYLPLRVLHLVHARRLSTHGAECKALCAHDTGTL